MLIATQLTGFGSGEIAPTHPANGMQLWLTPDSIQTSGGIVTAWNDASGNGRHLDVVSGSPFYSSAGGPGGNAAVDFDGIDDDFTRSGLTVATVFSATAYEYFVVLNVDEVDTDSTTVRNNDGPFGGTAGSRISPTLRTNGDVNFTHHGSGGEHSVLVTGAFSISTDIILHGRYDGSKISGRVNSTEGSDTLASMAADMTDVLSVGKNVGTASYWINGKLSEIIFYNSSLPTIDRENTLAYLSHKYGIAI